MSIFEIVFRGPISKCQDSTRKSYHKVVKG